MPNIEVAYALPHRQWLLPLQVAEGTTIDDALAQSKITAVVPDLDLAQATVGIYGKICSREQKVREGDRIEIYRPLPQDPKNQRRQRVALARKQRKSNS